MVCLQTMRGMDWFTRKVLAWRISNTLEAEFCLEARSEAVHKFGPPEIMNTDHPLVVCRQTPAHCPAGYACMPERGAARRPVHILRLDRPAMRAKTKISMDGKARYLDNIFIESLWRSLKYDCVYLHAWETGSQARAGVGRWITFYNHQRPHAAHGGQLNRRGLLQQH
jgi:putative transposase